MLIKKITAGTIHNMPADMQTALIANPTVLTLWEDITPLARNEFICWIENANQSETRNRRIQITGEELLEGKRRPCCWIGCIHRPEKPISSSVRGILEKRSAKTL